MVQDLGIMSSVNMKKFIEYVIQLNYKDEASIREASSIFMLKNMGVPMINLRIVIQDTLRIKSWN